MSIPFDDFGQSASNLFNDHHHAGSIKFNQTGKIGSGNAAYELNASNSKNGGPIEWNCEVSADFLKIKMDQEGNISKSLDFSNKNLPGLSVNWSPAFSKDGGVDLGNIKLNFSNDRTNANLSMALSKPDNAEFDLTSFLKKEGKKCPSFAFGFKTNLSLSGLNDPLWAFQTTKDGLTMSAQGKISTTDFHQKCSIYKVLPDNKNFTSYGVEKTSNGRLALAAAIGCEKSGYRYKIDNTGRLTVTNLSQINRAVNLALSAEVDMTALSNGGHKFGASISFE